MSAPNPTCTLVVALLFPSSYSDFALKSLRRTRSTHPIAQLACSTHPASSTCDELGSRPFVYILSPVLLIPSPIVIAVTLRLRTACDTDEARRSTMDAGNRARTGSGKRSNGAVTTGLLKNPVHCLRLEGREGGWRSMDKLVVSLAGITYGILVYSTAPAAAPERPAYHFISSRSLSSLTPLVRACSSPATASATTSRCPPADAAVLPPSAVKRVCSRGRRAGWAIYWWSSRGSAPFSPFSPAGDQNLGRVDGARAGAGEAGERAAHAGDPAVGAGGVLEQEEDAQQASPTARD
ncbi:hypothetical protein C8J57DRAFT_1517955 [Mycena rebaudengoi]|nr:hypothetical protein C8J57DRAFT_1517955 [Mycena rebaudengoi]